MIKEEVLRRAAGTGEHYQSEREDTGWGCGYRNIQMLVAALLGRGKVPGRLKTMYIMHKAIDIA